MNPTERMDCRGLFAEAFSFVVGEIGESFIYRSTGIKRGKEKHYIFCFLFPKLNEEFYDKLERGI